MSRPEDFTFEQKTEIILNSFKNYQLLCPVYGIIKCPSCYCKMALGFELKRDGGDYYGTQNYQYLHKILGYRLVPNCFDNISRIHLDHLTPIYQGGTATIDNGIMICENCNTIFREFLSKEDKLLLINNDDWELMDSSELEYKSINSKFIVLKNNKIIFKDKDIISSILFRRNINKKELETTPMYDYKDRLPLAFFYVEDMDIYFQLLFDEYFLEYLEFFE